MAKKYVRVKDKETGHEYDVLEHMVDDKKHEPVDREAWPVSTYPRPAKPNVKSDRPARAVGPKTTSTRRKNSSTTADKTPPATKSSTDGAETGD